MDSIIDLKIFYYIISNEKIKEYLSNMLDTMDLVSDTYNTILKSDEIWNEEVSSVYFSDWLYDKNPVELSDLKKELSIKLSKSKTISNSEYIIFEQKLDYRHEDYYNYNSKFLFLREEICEQPHFISTNQGFYGLLEWYLKKCTSKSSFIDACKVTYPNLIFHENNFSTINTLNNNFNNISTDIINHLSALNKYSANKEKYIGYDGKTKCSKFQSEYDINCSPESKRTTAKKLETIVKGDNGDSIVLNCEYHTKFNLHGREVEKQDRIYFSFGDENYHDGKIVIFHIGNHI